jgi:4-hydroxy-2-oxoheptanedioate aldolase
MRTNKLKDMLKAGTPAYGGWLVIPDAFSAEAVASLGYDFLVLDMQHGLMDYGDLVAMLQAISFFGPTPLVRIPWNELSTAQRCLDAGAEGIIFPMINNAAEAAECVASCRYGPAGKRSIGPTRARMHLGGPPHQMEQQVLCIPMIETVAGVENVDAILDVPGVDALWTGPADLRLSMGLDMPGAPDPRHAAALEHVVERCKAHGIPIGCDPGNGAGAKDAIAKGYAFACLGWELNVMTATLAEQLRIAREGK